MIVMWENKLDDRLALFTAVYCGGHRQPAKTGALTATPFLTSSVADPDPGSGAFLTPGSGISDPGSLIPRPYFEELFDNFFGKKFYNSLKIGPNFFL
jgi:hypothetical protein